MKNRNFNVSVNVLKLVSMFIILSVVLVACKPDIPKNSTNSTNSSSQSSNSSKTNGNHQSNPDEAQANSNTNTETPSKGTEETPNVAAASDPNSMAVLINKQFGLPEDFNPNDLVYPDVPFLFKEKIEKRQMRSEAAGALEELFAAAKKDGIYLAGVSAYRSNKTQTALFNRYVKKDGLEKAKTYSAEPGHSEHTTGLAIDVSGSTGKCAAESCFGDTDEAKWLDKNVSEYGFIIRYPEGKEKITGYKYEPWHLRYVGKEMAKDIVERGITLEEYYDAVPVSANP